MLKVFKRISNKSKNIDNQLIEQISHSNYIDSNMDYDCNSELSNKLHKFKYICSTTY